MAINQKIRIRLKAYDHEILTKAQNASSKLLAQWCQRVRSDSATDKKRSNSDLAVAS